jgi:uncharacterized protein
VSRENVELARQMNAAFNRGDREGAFAPCHPEVAWRDLAHAPDSPETVRGLAQVLAIWDQWQDAFEEFTADVEEYIDAGEAVVTVTHWRGRGKGSGTSVDVRRAEVYEFEHGRVVRVTQGFPGRDAALQAARRAG